MEEGVEPFNRFLLVDNDDRQTGWNQLYDPCLDDLLFGKNGLPQQLWQGQSFYKCKADVESDEFSCHPAVFDQLE